MLTLDQLKQDRISIQQELEVVRGLDHEPEVWEWLQECERLIAEKEQQGEL